MIRINLLPVREIKAEFGRRQDLMVAGVSLGLVFVLVLVVFLFQFYHASALEKELAGLRKEIETLTVQTKDVAQLEKKVGELKEKLKAIDLLSGKKTVPVQVMESLSSTVPARLWITEFKESAGSVSITGLADDNQSVADFLKALSSSSNFSNVDLVEAVQVEQDGMSIKKFMVKASLSYEAPSTPRADKAQTSQTAKKDGK
jgi:type IV pilus assembly protein PilN